MYQPHWYQHRKRLRLYGTNIPLIRTIVDKQICVEDILQDIQID